MSTAPDDELPPVSDVDNVLPPITDDDVLDEGGQTVPSRMALKLRQQQRAQAAAAKQAAEEMRLAIADAQALLEDNKLAQLAYGTSIFGYRLLRLMRAVVLHSLQRNYEVADAEKTADALLLLAEQQAAAKPVLPGDLKLVLEKETIPFLHALSQLR